MHHVTLVYMHLTTQPRNTAHAPGTLGRVPNQPKTPNRAIRVDTTLWRAAQEKAAAEGRTVTGVIVDYLRRYVAAPVRRKSD